MTTTPAILTLLFLPPPPPLLLLSTILSVSLFSYPGGIACDCMKRRSSFSLFFFSFSFRILFIFSFYPVPRQLASAETKRETLDDVVTFFRCTHTIYIQL